MNKTFLKLLILILVISGQLLNAQQSHLFEIGVSDSLYSEVLKEERMFWVQVPENFDPLSDRKYPVIYLLDGGVHLNAASTVHNYYYGGFFPEMIIVGISNRTHRTRDLTPSKVSSRRGSTFTQESGGAKTFTNFLKNELIPFVENKFPTTDYRTLIGHSYAGLFAINTLIHHTDLFDNYLAIDPSLDWDDQALLKQFKEITEFKKFNNKSIFLSLGGQLHMQNPDINIDNVMQDTSEYTLFARSIIEFAKFASDNIKNGFRCKWKFYKNDLHGSIPLPSILDGLVWAFKWFPIEHTDMFNSPETPTEELIQLIKNREHKLARNFGYKVPPFEEDLFNMLGYMNMEMGQPDKSLTFFKLNIEYFPMSPNAYDSIADYYASQNDFPNAFKSVAKAYELSGEDYHRQRMEEFKKK